MPIMPKHPTHNPNDNRVGIDRLHIFFAQGVADMNHFHGLEATSIVATAKVVGRASRRPGAERAQGTPRLQPARSDGRSPVALMRRRAAAAGAPGPPQ